MDIVIPVFLWLLGFIFFILALYEEREDVTDDEDEEKSDHLIVIFFIAASLMYISELHYSVITDSLVETLMPSYRPLMYIGLLFFFISLAMLVSKVFHILGYEFPWEGGVS